MPHCKPLAVMAAALHVSHAFAQAPGKELPPPPVPSVSAQAEAARAPSVARQYLGALSEPALPEAAPPRSLAKPRVDAPLERLEDAPKLPPMSLAERARAPKSASDVPPDADALVTTADLRDGEIRTGVRVTPRHGRAYTLTDPRQDAAYKQSEGSPLAGKAALPTWQLWRW